MNVLFTSCGRRNELLAEFRRAYVKLGLGGSILAVDIDPLAPALAEADRVFMVPQISDPKFVACLTSICNSNDVGLLVPLADRELSILARNKATLEASGTKLLIPSVAAARLTEDKYSTWEFFQSLDVPVPRCWLLDAGPNPNFDFPVFLKPRVGSAGENTHKINSLAELKFFSELVPDGMVQEFLSGPEVTTDVFSDFQGKVRAVVSRERIEVRWGEVAKGKTVHYPDVERHCVKIAEALESVGPITVQCIFEDGQPYFTEVNHRFAGGVPLSIAAGVPLPEWLLSWCLDLPVSTPALGEYETGLYMTRCDTSLFLREWQIAEIESSSLRP